MSSNRRHENRKARIASVTAPLFGKLSLRTRRQNPVLIFDDADFDAMLATTVRSSFSRSGEICLCGSRIFVHDAIYERFRTEFVAREATSCGRSARREDGTRRTRLRTASREGAGHRPRTARRRHDSLRRGEVIQPPGRCNKGWFIAPAVIEGLPHGCRTSQEEICRPGCVALPLQNGRRSGSGPRTTRRMVWHQSMWTRSLDRAHRVAANLQSESFG